MAHRKRNRTYNSDIYYSNYMTNGEVSVECIKCHSRDIQYYVDEKQKKGFLKEENRYICNACGKKFNDKMRLGPSHNNYPVIDFPRWSIKLFKFLLVIGVIVGVWYYQHLKGLKNENGTYYPYSIVDNVETTKEIFKIGEELYCDGKAFKVNSVDYPKTIDGKTPGSGNKFITIHFTVRNTSKKTRQRSASDLEILLSNGDKVSKIVYTNFNNVDIESGLTASGDATFEIPANEQHPILRYYCDYWIDELIAKVDLNK